MIGLILPVAVMLCACGGNGGHENGNEGTVLTLEQFHERIGYVLDGHSDGNMRVEIEYGGGSRAEFIFVGMNLYSADYVGGEKTVERWYAFSGGAWYLGEYHVEYGSWYMQEGLSEREFSAVSGVHEAFDPGRVNFIQNSGVYIDWDGNTVTIDGAKLVYYMPDLPDPENDAVTTSKRATFTLGGQSLPPMI